MFNPLHARMGEGRERVENFTDFNPDSQTLYQPPIDYFAPVFEWSPIEDDAAQFSPSFTSSPSELHGPIVSNQEGTASLGDGAMTPSLLELGEESLTSQKERRKAQNRNSQRALRKRQASYIASLESELQELRTKYKNLLRCFGQLKQAVDLVGQELWEKETELGVSVAVPS